MRHHVYLKPALASQGVKGFSNNRLTSAFVGSLGGGQKSFANNLYHLCGALWEQAVIMSKKQNGEMERNLARISHEI